MWMLLVGAAVAVAVAVAVRSYVFRVSFLILHLTMGGQMVSDVA
jgi:hypothetical protein